MTKAQQVRPGSGLASTPASSTMPEVSRRLDSGTPAGQTDRVEAPMNTPNPPSRLVDAWMPSDRRRLGFLSLRSYEQAAMSCPTDMWSYQQLFIEQRRDDRNPFAPRAVPS